MFQSPPGSASIPNENVRGRFRVVLNQGIEIEIEIEVENVRKRPSKTSCEVPYCPSSSLTAAKRFHLRTVKSNHTPHRDVAESLACFLCIIMLGQSQRSPFTRRRRQSPRSASIRCKTDVSHCSFTGRPFLLWFELGQPVLLVH